jgi:glycoside hydrolase-like protein
MAYSAYGVDYSTDRPNPDKLYAAGKRFVGRYVSYNTHGKNLTRPEADRLTNAGLSIYTIWEHQERSASGGYQVGYAHARDAASKASDAGAPDDAPIYFTADWDAGPTDFPIIGLYLQGAADLVGLPRVGIYGGYRTVDWVARHGYASWFAQTYAWSAGKWHPANHIEQYRNRVELAGGTVDLDRARVPDIGAWNRNEVVHQSFGDAASDYPIDPSWDYTGLIGGIGTDLASHTATLDTYTRLVTALRS